MTFSEEMQISCPPTVAFDLISDVRNETRWNGSVRSAELLTSEPVDRGSTLRTDHGRPLGQIESTIAVFDRPARLEYDATSAAMDLGITFTFTKTPDGTTIVGEFAPRPKGVMRLLFPLLRPTIRRDMATHFARFVALCEAEAHRD